MQNETISLAPQECWVNGTRVNNTKEDSCQYRVLPLAQLGLQNYLIGKTYGLQGFVSQVTIPNSNPPIVVPQFNTLFAKALSDGLSDASANNTYNILSTTIDMTTNMLSTSMRQLSGQGNWPARGTAYATDTFYDIHFWFLAMTHAVVAGSVMFFIATAWSTRCDHPWKTSALPLLFHGLTQPDRASIAEVPNIVDMREVADNLRVKVSMTAVGQRLATRDAMASG